MTIFRPCIDLHAGSVKQIVGGTLSHTPDKSASVNVTPTLDEQGRPKRDEDGKLVTNFTSEHPSSFYGALYRQHHLRGGHVIMLGPGNDTAAREALAAWPGALQVGGGIKDSNAQQWIEAGAEKVIVTSYLFPEGDFSLERLKSVLAALQGDKEKLVLDLSCRRVKLNDGSVGWAVATDKWTRITPFHITKENIEMLEAYCSEFLIHAADVEGLQQGIDAELVHVLAEWCQVPVTYAGGGRGISDLERVRSVSGGKVDLTIGSALDIFGGSGVTLEECVKWNRDNGGHKEPLSS